MFTVYRELDIKKLSEFTRDYLLAFEGQSDFVSNEKPRDEVVTTEIMDATVAYHLVDEDGQILAKYKTLDSALKAAASAKVTFQLEVDLPETGDELPLEDEEEE